jgi:hypothetical protein
MDFIRQRFLLLEFFLFMVYGVLIGAAVLLALRGPFELVRDPGQFLAAGFLGAMAGWCVMGLGRWVFGPMWQHTGWFWRLAYSIASSGIMPVSVLIVDLHANLVVARLYRGQSPIPYLLIGEFLSLSDVPQEMRIKSEPSCSTTCWQCKTQMPPALAVPGKEVTCPTCGKKQVLPA